MTAAGPHGQAGSSCHLDLPIRQVTWAGRAGQGCGQVFVSPDKDRLTNVAGLGCADLAGNWPLTYLDTVVVSAGDDRVACGKGCHQAIFFVF